jgi:hypothetical protein
MPGDDSVARCFAGDAVLRFAGRPLGILLARSGAFRGKAASRSKILVEIGGGRQNLPLRDAHR